MPKIQIISEDWDCYDFDTHVEEGVPSCPIVEVSDKALSRLFLLRDMADKYHSALATFYEQAMKKAREEEKRNQCKARLRPGRLCKKQVLPTQDVCADHFGIDLPLGKGQL